MALEEVLLGAMPRGGDLCREWMRRAEGAPGLEKAFENADRRVIRRALAFGGFAVPSAVGELLGEEAASEVLRRLAKIGAESEDAAVDARLDFAVEEAVAAMLGRAQVPAAFRAVPLQVRVEATDGGSDGGAGRIDAGGAQ
jgi:hypothetical protein